MNYYSMADKAIMVEIGVRLRGLRLRRNITQQQLANSAVLSLNVIKGLEAGRGRAAARNHGARVARGELLIFLDDDILTTLSFVQAHRDMQNKKPGLVHGRLREL